MKHRINQLLNWFEDHFNFMIELLAFIGGIFCLLFAIFLFFMRIFNQQWFFEDSITFVFLPGLIGFFGVLILFALRITRYLTKK